MEFTIYSTFYMLKKQYLDCIPQTVIDEIIEDYNSREEYQTTTMNKADPGLSLSLVLPFCQSLLGNDIEFKSGNFYKHKQPYLPHTDYRVKQGNELNIVIPLQYTGAQASLVVFDQAWFYDSITWCMHNPVIKFSVNTGVAGCPNGHGITNHTNRVIDNEFYKKYLSHYQEVMLYGMSGDAFPFTPTSIIVFDNRLIHCTSNFIGEKLGLSLRFARS